MRETAPNSRETGPFYYSAFRSIQVHMYVWFAGNISQLYYPLFSHEWRHQWGGVRHALASSNRVSLVL